MLRRSLLRFVEDHSHKAVFVENLGTRRYFSLLKTAALMIGNSSSGIIEAPSFAIPVINIGTRQEGRVRAQNVIDVPAESEAIAGAIETASTATFRAGIAGTTNPYGNGGASKVIARRLETQSLDDELIQKRFVDLTESK